MPYDRTGERIDEDTEPFQPLTANGGIDSKARADELRRILRDARTRRHWEKRQLPASG